jgi:hypothetical protein
VEIGPGRRRDPRHVQPARRFLTEAQCGHKLRWYLYLFSPGRVMFSIFATRSLTFLCLTAVSVLSFVEYARADQVVPGTLKGDFSVSLSGSAQYTVP